MIVQLILAETSCILFSIGKAINAPNKHERTIGIVWATLWLTNLILTIIHHQ